MLNFALTDHFVVQLQRGVLLLGKGIDHFHNLRFIVPGNRSSIRPINSL